MSDLQVRVRRLSLLYLPNQSDPYTSRKSFDTSMLLAAQHLHVLHVTDCTACAFTARHPTTKPGSARRWCPSSSREEPQTVCLVAGQKRKRAEHQAAALVGMKKPHPTPPPEAETGTVAPSNGEHMDHDEHSAEPSGKPAESELHVDSLGGAPQVPLGSHALFDCLVCSSALHLYLTIRRSWLAICAEICMADSTAFFCDMSGVCLPDEYRLHSHFTYSATLEFLEITTKAGCICMVLLEHQIVICCDWLCQAQCCKLLFPLLFFKAHFNRLVPVCCAPKTQICCRSLHIALLCVLCGAGSYRQPLHF